MRTPLSSSFLIAALLVSTPALAADEVRNLAESVPVDGARGLEIDLPVGQLLLEGADGDAVEVTMSVRCEEEKERCRERAEKIRLVTDRRDDLVVLKVEGLTRGTAAGVDVKLLVTAPRTLRAEMDLAVGKVAVRDMAADLEIDLGVGDVEVRMARTDVKRVELDAGVGETTLRTDLGEIEGSGIVGSGLTWSQGQGSASVEIDTGVGQIVVDLR